MKLSVITLTKNRAPLLALHLEALMGQLAKGDEIVIVDNGSADTTREVIASHTGKLPIRAFVSHARGLPALYNLAIKKSRNPIILFYDDDCIAGPGFVAAHRAAHATQTPSVAQGMTHSLPQGNIYAEIMGDHYRDWLEIQKLPDGSMRTFDNKNASLPKRLLTRYGLYDTTLKGGAEDIELGMRLVANGVRIILHPECVARHYERTTMRGFVRQHLRFASTDALLSKRRPAEPTISMLHSRKITMHLSHAWKRELNYLRKGTLGNALLLPVIYAVLLFTRIWGYARAK